MVMVVMVAMVAMVVMVAMVAVDPMEVVETARAVVKAEGMAVATAVAAKVAIFRRRSSTSDHRSLGEAVQIGP